MADNTKIEWCDATWNPITGCSVVSPGCTNCYAMQLAGTRLKHTPSREGLTKCVNGNHVWNGEVRLNENTLDQPLKWKRPRKIFVCAHGDLFHENVPFAWIDKVFAIMALCPHHTFIVLTKRAARMREYIKNKRDLVTIFGVGRIFEYQKVWPLQNLWLGVSVENQETANERIPILLDTPAAVRFISAEPLLGAIDLNALEWEGAPSGQYVIGWESCLSGKTLDWLSDKEIDFPKLDWVIVGGESGKNARPLHPDWVRKIRDDCTAINVPFFFKQWGEWMPYEQADAPFYQSQDGHYVDGHLLPTPDEDPKWTEDWFDDEFNGQCLFKKLGKKIAGNSLDGVQHLEFPTHHAVLSAVNQ